MTLDEPRARILCIDDEPAVLAGLQRQLHYHFDVTGACGGEEGLGALDDPGCFAAVVCDMRMPGMNGAEVLAQARARHPDTTRMLLTGHADLEAAMAAVNRGGIFRFLFKPATSLELRRALDDAVAQHRTMLAERELLEQTLRGAVAALVDALALANPVAFARATRIQALVRQLLDQFQPPDTWQIEVAVMLSQIGTVVLPHETVDKLHRGLPLSEDEHAQMEELPNVAERVLGQIPRLEEIVRIIRRQAVPFAHCRYGEPPSAVVLGGQMLRVATALDTLEAGGVERRNAVSALLRSPDDYDPALLTCFLDDVEADDVVASCVPRPVSTDELQVGWTIEEDIRDELGRLVIGRGYVVTETLLERLANWQGPALQEPVFVT